MTASMTGRDLARIQSEAERAAAEIVREYPHGGDRPHRGRRCRICANPESLELVNRLLAHGMNYPSVVETCQAFNETRPKNFKITYASVRWHANYHFNVQEPAQAAWRKIMERRKAQHASEAATVAEGAEALLTIYGYLEVLGQKGFETTVDKDTTISPELGMNALLRLHELTQRGAGEAELLEMRRQVSMLQQAVRDVVPEELWAQISERISEIYNPKSEPDIVDAEVVADDDDYGYDDEAYAPQVDSDPDDAIGDD